jgi:hypothetical protein
LRTRDAKGRFEAVNLRERFEESFCSEPFSGCWLWTATTSGKSQPWIYGKVKVGQRKRFAHRVAWELYRGPIPKGVCVLHHCDTPLCVNPAHLFLGTFKANTRDAVSKGRHPHGETNGAAKLTDAQVAEIRTSNEGKRKIARRFGIQPNYVRQLRQYKWRKRLTNE